MGRTLTSLEKNRKDQGQGILEEARKQVFERRRFWYHWRLHTPWSTGTFDFISSPVLLCPTILCSFSILHVYITHIAHVPLVLRFSFSCWGRGIYGIPSFSYLGSENPFSSFSFTSIECVLFLLFYSFRFGPFTSVSSTEAQLFYLRSILASLGSDTDITFIETAVDF